MNTTNIYMICMNKIIVLIADPQLVQRPISCKKAQRYCVINISLSWDNSDWKPVVHKRFQRLVFTLILAVFSLIVTGDGSRSTTKTYIMYSSYQMLLRRWRLEQCLLYKIVHLKIIDGIVNLTIYLLPIPSVRWTLIITRQHLKLKKIILHTYEI